MINETHITSALLYQTSRKVRALQESFRVSLIGEEDRSTAKAIFVLVNRICNSLLRRLTAIAGDAEHSENNPAYQNEIRIISYLVDSLAQTYELVRNSRSMGYLDFIVRPLENLVKSIHYDSRVIVNSVTDYNYTYDELVYVLVDPLKNVQGISEQGLLQDDVPSKIVKLGFPLAESANVLSYSGLAHEIAHFIFEVNNLENTYTVEYSQSQYETIQRLIISESTAKAQKSLLEEIEQTELLEEITAIVHSWIKETVCDCLAVYIMGPAFLFTLYDTLSLLGNIYRWKASANKKYYPPPIVRFANVLKCLKEIRPFRWVELMENDQHEDQGSKFNNIRNAVTDHLNQIEVLSSHTKLNLDAKRQLALQMTESTMGKLHDEGIFKKWTEKIAFPVDEFSRELMNLDWKLFRNVPINESRQGTESRVVPDFRIILNVGWVHHLVGQSRFMSYDARLDAQSYSAFELKNRVLKKSLELAEFDTLFRRGKANGSFEK